jgi:DNA-binding response OmpR family regulator
MMQTDAPIKQKNDVPRQILVMEDELNLAKSLDKVLSEEGYLVDVAMSGQAALDSFNSKSIDLLIADLRLPDINGMEVIRQIKTQHPEIAVVVITGYASVSSAVDAMKLGAHDYLPKPFTAEQIKEAIDDALGDLKVPAQLPIVAKVEAEEEKLIQKREVLRVLNRTAEDLEFWKDLMETGSEALQEYRLSMEAKAAIVTGDIKWINENVGELTQKQLKFLIKCMEREAW